MNILFSEDHLLHFHFFNFYIYSKKKHWNSCLVLRSLLVIFTSFCLLSLMCLIFLKLHTSSIPGTKCDPYIMIVAYSTQQCSCLCFVKQLNPPSSHTGNSSIFTNPCPWLIIIVSGLIIVFLSSTLA